MISAARSGWWKSSKEKKCQRESSPFCAWGRELSPGPFFFACEQDFHSVFPPLFFL